MAFSAATPMAIAAQEGHGKVVQMLLSSGADPRIGSDTLNPATVAKEAGHTNILGTLIDAEVELGGGPDPDWIGTVSEWDDDFGVLGKIAGSKFNHFSSLTASLMASR